MSLKNIAENTKHSFMKASVKSESVSFENRRQMVEFYKEACHQAFQSECRVERLENLLRQALPCLNLMFIEEKNLYNEIQDELAKE